MTLTPAIMKINSSKQRCLENWFIWPHSCKYRVIEIIYRLVFICISIKTVGSFLNVEGKAWIHPPERDMVVAVVISFTFCNNVALVQLYTRCHTGLSLFVLNALTCDGFFTLHAGILQFSILSITKIWFACCDLFWFVASAVLSRAAVLG